MWLATNPMRSFPEKGVRASTLSKIISPAKILKSRSYTPEMGVRGGRGRKRGETGSRRSNKREVEQGDEEGRR
jgi:hypothetical protein